MMRGWINLVESAEPNWKRIVDHIINEMGDSGETEMIEVRMYMGLTPYDASMDDTPEFAAAAREWAEDQARAAFENIRWLSKNKDVIRAWRVITAPKNWTPNSRHPGLFWSWDKNAAEAHWGSFDDGHVQWIIEADIPLSSIDMEATLTMNSLASYQEEKEIRIKPDAPVNIIKYAVHK